MLRDSRPSGSPGHSYDTSKNRSRTGQWEEEGRKVWQEEIDEEGGVVEDVRGESPSLGIGVEVGSLEVGKEDPPHHAQTVLYHPGQGRRQC